MDTSPILHAVVTDRGANPGLVEQIQRFRAQLFVTKLGWNLPIREGREFDQFDVRSTVYCALFDGTSLVGCFRAIRSDRPYLGRDVFPEVADERPWPCRPDVWEISRFGVMYAGAHYTVSQALYGLVFRIGFEIGARGLVALADLNHERFVAAIGIKTQRLGRVHTIGVDHFGRPIDVLGGEIPLDQFDQRFEKILRVGKTMEIEDETQILRRSLVSA